MQAEARLLTLTGIGGSGKTRLGLRLAETQLDAFPDGVWFVDVAPLTEPERLVESLAAVLGVRDEPGRSLLDGVLAWLKPRRALVLFDNAETHSRACATLATELLRTCPQTKMLVTNADAGPVAWLPDSRRLIVWSGENSGVFDTEIGEQLTKFNPSNSAIALLDEGKQVVFEPNSRLHFYDTSTGQKLREGKDRGGIGGGAMLAPNGNEVLAPRGRSVWLFDASTGQKLRDFAFSHPWPHGNFSVQPSPDSSFTAITAPLDYDPVLVIADAQTGAKRHELSHDKGNVTRVARA